VSDNNRKFEESLKLLPGSFEPAEESLHLIRRDYELLISFAANACGIVKEELRVSDLCAWTKRQLGA